MSRYWYLGPLKTRAAHWFSSLKVSVVLHWQWSYFSYIIYEAFISVSIGLIRLSPLLQQWPQSHQASLSYLGPVPRPPDLPTEIPPRPNLLYRIYRRLQNYWNPPIEGILSFLQISLYIEYSRWIGTGHWHKFYDSVLFRCFGFNSLWLDIDSFWYLSGTVHDIFSEGKKKIF